VGLLADALGVGRLVAAAAFPFALAHDGWLPLALFAFAAASDFVDGPLARRAGPPSAYGGVLDNVADVAFVLAATIAGVTRGVLSAGVPASIALSAGAYAHASFAASRATGAPTLARNRLGHAAGVANWICAGLVAGAGALPSACVTVASTLAAVGTVTLNLLAFGARVRPRLPSDAR
jgi:phosphatidylglycerophosphate synthase